jgi:hypothetical protein
MKDLTIAGDITYFTINGGIYGIDTSDNSAVHCHDESSPAERIDYMDMCNILECSDIDQTEYYEEYATIWHFEGFDVVAREGEFHLTHTYI